jgi:polysaccharide biosynthesis/export protein
MLKVIVIAAAAALLSGCAASSLSDVDGDNKIASDSSALKQRVTDSTTPTSASPEPTAPTPLTGTREARLTSATATDAVSLRSSAAEATAAVTPNNLAYKIGPGDILDVTVFKVAELSKSAQVSEAGTINYPLVGDVPVAGKTPRQVEREMTSMLGARYLQRPQVSVFVKEFNSQRITIEGAVKRPGVYPIQGSLSLLQAVAQAQGMEEVADEEVVVFRSVNGGKRTAARFDIGEIRTGDAPDPQLEAGDVIVAGKSALKEGWANVMKVLPVMSVFTLI